MGNSLRVVTIQYESEHAELGAILVMDHDPEILEFYDQAYTFKIQYLGKSGKKWGLEYRTPRYGGRPFEIVHLDHMGLDIELRYSATRHLLSKPWVTLIRNATSSTKPKCPRRVGDPKLHRYPVGERESEQKS